MSPFIPTLANLAVLTWRGVGHGCAGFNTVQHHDLHHRYPAKHFSLYFTHWDRACGTLHPRYDASIFAYFPLKQHNTRWGGGAAGAAAPQKPVVASADVDNAAIEAKADSPAPRRSLRLRTA
jgi:Delta7-sterol 5-desaturase